MPYLKKPLTERLEQAISIYLDEGCSILVSAKKSQISKDILSTHLAKRGLVRTNVTDNSKLETAVTLYVVEGLPVIAASQQAGIGTRRLSAALIERQLMRTDRRSANANGKKSGSRIDPLESKESRVSRMALAIIHKSAAPTAPSHQGTGR